MSTYVYSAQFYIRIHSYNNNNNIFAIHLYVYVVTQETMEVKVPVDILDNKVNQELLDLLVELENKDHQVEKDYCVKKRRYIAMIIILPFYFAPANNQIGSPDLRGKRVATIGPLGEKASKGDYSYQGIRGVRGYTGLPGDPGISGYDGTSGDKGEKGTYKEEYHNNYAI